MQIFKNLWRRLRGNVRDAAQAPSIGTPVSAPTSTPIIPAPAKSTFASVVAEVIEAANAKAIPEPPTSSVSNNANNASARDWSPAHIELAQRIWGVSFHLPGGTEFTRQQLQCFTPLREGGKFLDANAGLGGALQTAAENFPLATSGLIVNPSLYRHARASLAKSGAQIVPLRQVSLTELELPPNAHDYIFVRDLLWDSAGKPRLLTQLCQSLHEHGQMVVIDLMPIEGTDNAALHAWLQQQGIASQVWSAPTIEKFIRTQPDMECRSQDDLTRDYIDLVTQGWRNFLPSLLAQKPSKDFLRLVLAEVVYWAELVTFLESGQLSYRRLHLCRKPLG